MQRMDSDWFASHKHELWCITECNACWTDHYDPTKTLLTVSFWLAGLNNYERYVPNDVKRHSRHIDVSDVDVSNARRPADIQCERHPPAESLITVNSGTNIT